MTKDVPLTDCLLFIRLVHLRYALFLLDMHFFILTQCTAAMEDDNLCLKVFSFSLMKRFAVKIKTDSILQCELII